MAKPIALMTHFQNNKTVVHENKVEHNKNVEQKWHCDYMSTLSNYEKTAAY